MCVFSIVSCCSQFHAWINLYSFTYPASSPASLPAPTFRPHANATILRYLREVDIDRDDDEMTMEVERILGGAEQLQHLPHLLRLVAAEDIMISSHVVGRDANAFR